MPDFVAPPVAARTVYDDASSGEAASASASYISVLSVSGRAGKLAFLRMIGATSTSVYVRITRDGGEPRYVRCPAGATRFLRVPVPSSHISEAAALVAPIEPGAASATDIGSAENLASFDSSLLVEMRADGGNSVQCRAVAVHT